MMRGRLSEGRELVKKLLFSAIGAVIGALLGLILGIGTGVLLGTSIAVLSKAFGAFGIGAVALRLSVFGVLIGAIYGAFRGWKKA